jgi:hypothetical protein
MPDIAQIKAGKIALTNDGKVQIISGPECEEFPEVEIAYSLSAGTAYDNSGCTDDFGGASTIQTVTITDQGFNCVGSFAVGEAMSRHCYNCLLPEAEDSQALLVVLSITIILFGPDRSTYTVYAGAQLDPFGPQTDPEFPEADPPCSAHFLNGGGGSGTSGVDATFHNEFIMPPGPFPVPNGTYSTDITLTWPA